MANPTVDLSELTAQCNKQATKMKNEFLWQTVARTVVAGYVTGAMNAILVDAKCAAHARISSFFVGSGALLATCGGIYVIANIASREPNSLPIFLTGPALLGFPCVYAPARWKIVESNQQDGTRIHTAVVKPPCWKAPFDLKVNQAK